MGTGRVGIVLLLVALLGCSGTPSQSSSDSESSEDLGFPWDMAGSWRLELKKLQMHVSSNCNWDADEECGYTGKPACTVISSMNAIKKTETTAHFKIYVAGLAGYNFYGDIDANNNFHVDHESNWSDSYAEGSFEDVNRTVTMTILYNPDNYNCSAELELEGTPL